MPVYVMRNKKTGKVFEHVMHVSEYDAYMEAHPNVERHHTPDQMAPLVDPLRLSATRHLDGGFKEVLQKIHETTPGSRLNSTSSQM